MHSSVTTLSRNLRMGAPSWLALVALLCWAALFNPAQFQQRFVAGLLDGVGIPSAIMSQEPNASLQTNDRQRSDATREGNPPSPAIVATQVIERAVVSIRRIV